MKDAMGTTLYPGDFVAHISRHGSSVFKTRRQVVETHEDFVYLDGPLKRRVQTHNLVKTYDQEIKF